MYGRGYKQKRIVELGKAGKLRYRDIVLLYGHSKAFDEVCKLKGLGLIEWDERIHTLNTKTLITWVGK